MKNYKFVVDGGGVFSKFLQCSVIPLADVDFDNVYLKVWDLPSTNHGNPYWPLTEITIKFHQEASEYHVDPYDALFNYVLDQDSNGYVDQGMLPIGTLYKSSNKIENSPRFLDYKNVVSRIKLKPHLLQDIESRSLGIDWTRTLGVHLRLNAGDDARPNPVTLDRYLSYIDNSLRNYPYQHIFVSCDTTTVIDRLQSIYGEKIIVNRNFHRPSNEDIWGGYIWERTHYFKRFYWWEAFVDCLMLARARGLICRISNFSNAAIVFGNYDEILRVEND